MKGYVVPRTSPASNNYRQAARTLFLSVMVSSLAIVAALGFVGRTVNASAPAMVVIKMLDMPPSFEPAQVTIHVGDTIKWENVGNSVHHATDDFAAAIKSDDVARPAGAKPFDSGFIPPGTNFTQTFTIPGTYKYVCAAHETSGMSGEVVVR
jgi:plastocyanin